MNTKGLFCTIYDGTGKRKEVMEYKFCMAMMELNTTPNNCYWCPFDGLALSSGCRFGLSDGNGHTATPRCTTTTFVRYIMETL